MEYKKPKYLALHKATFTDETDGKVKLIDYENLNAEQIAVFKYITLNSLYMFVQFWFYIVYRREFNLNWHQELICNELTKAAAYEIEFLNINIPPRLGKTELAGVNFVSWSIAKNPQANNLYITYAGDLKTDTSRKIQNIVKHPLFKRMYGVEIRKDSTAKDLWVTTQNGTFKAATIGGSITGFGAGIVKPDLTDLIEYIAGFNGSIILDDINKIADTTSQNKRNQTVIDTVLNTVLSRKNSPDTPIINIQQRAGLQDITATLLKFYEKKVKKSSIVLPIYTLRHSTNEKGEDIVIKDYLWESRFGEEQCNEIKDNPLTSATFETQYLQVPVAAGDLFFEKSKLKYFELKDIENKNVEMVLSFTDPNAAGDDYFSTAFVKLIENKLYVFDVIFRNKQDNCLYELYEKITKYNSFKNIIENNTGSVYLQGQLLQFFLPQVKVKSDLEKYIKTLKYQLFFPKESLNKEVRITNWKDFILGNIYFRKDITNKNVEYYDFMENLTNYCKSAKHDDAADVCAAISKFSFNNFGIIKNNI